MDGLAPPQPATPALVLCGSLHPAARAQIATLGAEGWTVVEILDADDRHADPPLVDRLALVTPALVVGQAGHDGAAAALASAGRRCRAGRSWSTLVVVGGDTAAAVLGDEPLLVGGLLGPGIPWAHRVDGTGPLVVTKPGGFGAARSLVDLFAGPFPA